MIIELLADSTLTLVAYKGAGYGLSLTRAHLKAKAAKGWEATRKRIYELEIATGQQDYDADTIDWLKRKIKPPIAVEDYMKDLVANGNSTCEVVCQSCGKHFKPRDDFDHYHHPSNKWAKNKVLMQTFCVTCIEPASKVFHE